MLPGMVPIIAGGAAPGISLSYVNYEPSTATSPSLPTGTTTNDLVVVIRSSFGASFPSDVTPSGWTKLITGTSTYGSDSVRMGAFARIIQSGDGSTVTGLPSGGYSNQAVLLTFRPSAPISSLTGGGWSIGLTARSVAASAGVAPLVVIGATLGTGPPTLSGSPAWDATMSVDSARDITAGYKIYDSSPADHSSISGGANLSLAGYIQVAA